jgi:hypothetical protein
VKECENAMKFLALKEGPFKSKNILYPVVNGRKFREAWFNQYQWIEYSSSLNAAFCFFFFVEHSISRIKWIIHNKKYYTRFCQQQQVSN